MEVILISLSKRLQQPGGSNEIGKLRARADMHGLEP
jgi:hypothetical protein